MNSLGRAKRVVVVAADNVTGSTLLQWVGSSFLSLGALTNKDKIEEAALPFDKRRSGTILGAGAVGLVVETAEAARSRGAFIKARVLATHIANSALHASRLDGVHIRQELNKFLADVERTHGITREQMVSDGLVYMSHETYTNSSEESSCSFSEISALYHAFGKPLAKDIIVVSTKGALLLCWLNCTYRCLLRLYWTRNGLQF